MINKTVTNIHLAFCIFHGIFTCIMPLDFTHTVWSWSNRHLERLKARSPPQVAKLKILCSFHRTPVLLMFEQMTQHVWEETGREAGWYNIQAETPGKAKAEPWLPPKPKQEWAPPDPKSLFQVQRCWNGSCQAENRSGSPRKCTSCEECNCSVLSCKVSGLFPT